MKGARATVFYAAGYWHFSLRNGAGRDLARSVDDYDNQHEAVTDLKALGVEAIDVLLLGEPTPRAARKRREKSPFVPPTVEEVASFVEAKGLKVDPIKFVAKYDAIDWFMGKTKMTNWRAAVVYWERSAQ